MSVAICIPARNEAATVASVVSVAVGLQREGLADEVVVVDDGSADDTGTLAAAAGARVIRSSGTPGKGQALREAITVTSADNLVFLDADVRGLSRDFVVRLVEPLLVEPGVRLVKPRYRRSYRGIAGEGGRVTELLARPLLRRFRPELAHIAQPLGGECAVRRDALAEIPLADGYGIEIGLLLDVADRFGVDAIAEVDLGDRVHRNRALRELEPHCDAVLDALLRRVALRA